MRKRHPSSLIGRSVALDTPPVHRHCSRRDDFAGVGRFVRGHEGACSPPRAVARRSRCWPPRCGSIPTPSTSSIGFSRLRLAGGGHHHPPMELAGLYVDQFPDGDLTRTGCGGIASNCFQPSRRPSRSGARTCRRWRGHHRRARALSAHGEGTDALPPTRVLQPHGKGLRVQRTRGARLQRQASFD